MIDRLKGLEASLGPQAEMLREQAMNLAAVAQERLAEGNRRVKDFIAARPAQALGIALGVGVFLGWLIKRR